MDLKELQQHLGGVELSFADKLDAGDIDRYGDMLTQASRQQAHTLQQASEESLKHVPALLRGAVRKLLF